MNCAQENCTSPATVEVHVSTSNNKGDDTETVSICMCEDHAFEYQATDVLGFGFMGNLG